MAVYQKRNNELVEVPCDCGSGGSGGNIVISDAIDSTSSFTAASSKAVKTAYDHAGDLVQSQLDNQESQLNVGIVNKINNCIQDKIDSGEIGNGSGDVPATVLNRINNNETRSLTNASNISSLKSDVSSLKTSIGNASGFNTRITELETKQITDRSDIDNLQSTLQDYNALKTQVEANKNKLDQISSGSGGSGGSTGSLADIESKITKLRQDVDQNTANLGSTSSQVEQNKDDIEALEQLIGDLPSVTDVHNLSNRISKNASDIEVLQGAINDLSGGSFSEFSESLATINQEIAVLKTNDDELTADLTAVSTLATETEQELNQFKTDVNGAISIIDNDITEIKEKYSDINALDEDIAKIDASIVTTASDIRDINNSIEEINNKLLEVETSTINSNIAIEHISSELDTFSSNTSTNISSLNSQIQGISTTLDNNDVLHAELRYNLAQLEQRISDLETNVSEYIDSSTIDIGRIQNSTVVNAKSIVELNSSLQAISSFVENVQAEFNKKIADISETQWCIVTTENSSSSLRDAFYKLKHGGFIAVMSNE